jgi:hypothetical protein
MEQASLKVLYKTGCYREKSVNVTTPTFCVVNIASVSGYIYKDSPGE